MNQSLMRLAPGPSKIYLVNENRFLIGRDEICDLVLEDELASRQHACIEVKPDATSWVVDTKSLNGVLVNNLRVTGTQPLRHLDVITVGRARFRFFEAETFRDSQLGFSS